jgi:phosphohistidine phosphatase
MRRLFLLRHAKSDWSAGAADDHARPLNARGQQAAKQMGASMCAQGFVPSLVLCSSAARTRETWALVKAAMKISSEERFTRDLYLASPDALLETLRAAPDEASGILLIGHNPGIKLLALYLMRKRNDVKEEAYRKALAEKFPTGALAVFSFDAPSWQGIALHSGRLDAYMRPRELEKGTS